MPHAEARAGESLDRPRLAARTSLYAKGPTKKITSLLPLGAAAAAASPRCSLFRP